MNARTTGVTESVIPGLPLELAGRAQAFGTAAVSALVGAAATTAVCIAASQAPVAAPVLAAEAAMLLESYTGGPDGRAGRMLRAGLGNAAVLTAPTVGPWWTPLAMWAAATAAVYRPVLALRGRAGEEEPSGPAAPDAVLRVVYLGPSPAPAGAAGAGADLDAAVDRISAGVVARNPDAFGPTCRVCGCTVPARCTGGCWFVVVDAGSGSLCSQCLPSTGSAVTITDTEEE